MGKWKEFWDAYKDKKKLDAYHLEESADDSGCLYAQRSRKKKEEVKHSW